VAPVTSPIGGFGIEGDLLANLPAPNVGDWIFSTNASIPGSGGGFWIRPACHSMLRPRSISLIRTNAGTDFVFTGGHKWFDNPNTWEWTTGKSSSKTDINNVLLHLALDADGHVWTAISADRLSTSGDSYIDFEFLQNALTRQSDGTFVSAGPHGGRTTNDVLLSLAFTGGGSTADFFAWRWQADGNGGFAYADVTASLPAGRVFVALNNTTIRVPYGAFGETNYPPNAFAEAAVDLTALLSAFDACMSFGFKSIMVKTKASQSPTATIEDFIDPIQYTLRIGPRADAGVDQTRCLEGDSTAFPLNGAASAGFFPVVSATWSVVTGTATIESTNSLLTTAHVLSASATLRLTVIQSNGCTETDDVVLTVAPLPTCSVTGPSLVCPRSSTEFHGPPGMALYSWSVSGNGSISGPTNAPTVTVSAGSACGENFTLLLNVISNDCPGLCTADILVNDTIPPTLACPEDLILQCPADTRTNATGVATAQDDCGQVTVNYNDVASNGCGGTTVIARTWTATDQCGNSSSRVQTITVRDTTAPVIACPRDIVVECPSPAEPSVTGTATATEACGTAHVTYSDAITPGANCAADHIVRTIRRTWTATDECGNSSSCVQTITVRDTTAPLITCPPDVVVECPGSTDPAMTGTATATEACGTAHVTYSDVMTPGANCAVDHLVRIIRRTWTATDDCGNSSSRVQTITVKDTMAPRITCPDNVVLECPSSTEPSGTGTATGEDGCSAVAIRYSDVVNNGCGGAKVIARTWTATDECGNSASRVQTITVQDTIAPIIACPPDLVLECSADTRPNATGVAVARMAAVQ
jgi:hypothetical protein